MKFFKTGLMFSVLIDEPSIVPDKLKNPINFKILILIGLVETGIQSSYAVKQRYFSVNKFKDEIF